MMEHSSPQTLEAGAGKSYAAGEYREAAELYDQAARAYRDGGDPLQAAEMDNNRCVALLQIGRSAEALEIVRGTDQLFAEAGDHHRRAVALANIGTALEEEGEKEEALAHYRESAQIFQEHGEKELYAQVMKSISGLQLRGRDPLGAVVSMQHGLDEAEKPSLVQRLLQRLLKIPSKLLPK